MENTYSSHSSLGSEAKSMKPPSNAPSRSRTTLVPRSLRRPLPVMEPTESESLTGSNQEETHRQPLMKSNEDFRRKFLVQS